jgi:hypothetical protein
VTFAIVAREWKKIDPGSRRAVGYRAKRDGFAVRRQYGPRRLFGQLAGFKLENTLTDLPFYTDWIQLSSSLLDSRSCTLGELAFVETRRKTRLAACGRETTGVAVDRSTGMGGLHTRLGDPLAWPAIHTRKRSLCAACDRR